MKLLAPFVCLMAIIMIASAKTLLDTALHGGQLYQADLEECYKRANLIEGSTFLSFLRENLFLSKPDLITDVEIKDGSFRNPENAERAKKNGCLTLCIYEKRGLIIGSQIQKNRLYAKSAHAELNKAIQDKIRANVDSCTEEGKNIYNISGVKKVSHMLSAIQ